MIFIFGRLSSLARFLFLVIFACAVGSVSAQTTPVLGIEVKAGLLEFQLEADDPIGFWMLQSSTDGLVWEDLIGLERAVGAEGFEIAFGRKALQGAAYQAALFRAVEASDKGGIYRRFLAERVKWRASGISSYMYVVRSGGGMVDWEARYTVVDGEVTMMETISINPPFFTAPADLTIEDWFDTVSRAIEQNAVTIDIDWNAERGYPERGFIDLDSRLADEEQSWAISELTPLE